MSDVVEVVVPDEGAVAAAVRAALAETGRPVGDGERPTSPTDEPLDAFPYTVVWGGGQVDLDGSWDRPFEDGTSVVQVDSVGRDTTGTEWMRHQARRLILDRRRLDVADRTVTRVRLIVGRPVARDDDVSPALFRAVDIFHIWTTPARGGTYGNP